MKKSIISFISLISVLFLFTSCLGNVYEKSKTDEELIRERVSSFVTSYNDGDWDATIENLDKKSRRQFDAYMNIFGGLLGGLTGFSFDLSDFFSLGVSTSGEDDYMEVNISKVVFRDSEHAVAVGEMAFYNQKTSVNIFFYMVKEEDGWYISDMTDKNKYDIEIGD